MILLDVNVLVYTFRREATHHQAYATWLAEVVAGRYDLALHDVPLAGFVRIVTSARIMATPASTVAALDFVARLVGARRARWVSSGPSTWRAMADVVAVDRGLTRQPGPGRPPCRRRTGAWLPARDRRPRLRAIPRLRLVRPGRLGGVREGS